MKTKKERLAAFKAALDTDPYAPTSAEDAVRFIKDHLDAMETEALPPKLHSDYSVRMLLPSLALGAGAGWAMTGNSHTWVDNDHDVEISNSGAIKITLKSGNLWFSRP